MPPAELSLANFNVLCGKADGRDKLARFAQYGARAVFGFTVYVGPNSSEAIKEVSQCARNLMVQLAGARRAHRWCKEIPVIQGIPATLRIEDPMDRFLELLTKSSLATFMMIDHFAYLKQLRIVRGHGGSWTVRFGLKFFCFSNACAVIYNLKKLAVAEKAEERSKLKQNATKHGLLVVQCLHLTRLYETHDLFVGVLGMITSYMDLVPQWPQAKAAAVANGK